RSARRAGQGCGAWPTRHARAPDPGYRHRPDACAARPEDRPRPLRPARLPPGLTAERTAIAYGDLPAIAPQMQEKHGSAARRAHIWYPDWWDRPPDSGPCRTPAPLPASG